MRFLKFMDDVSKTLWFYASPFLCDIGISGFLKKSYYIKFVKYTGLFAELLSVFTLLLGLYGFYIFFKRALELNKNKLSIYKIFLKLIYTPFLYIFFGFIIFNIIHYKFYHISNYFYYYISFLIVCFYSQCKLVDILME